MTTKWEKTFWLVGTRRGTIIMLFNLLPTYWKMFRLVGIVSTAAAGTNNSSAISVRFAFCFVRNGRNGRFCEIPNEKRCSTVYTRCIIYTSQHAKLSRLRHTGCHYFPTDVPWRFPSVLRQLSNGQQQRVGYLVISTTKRVTTSFKFVSKI